VLIPSHVYHMYHVLQVLMYRVMYIFLICTRARCPGTRRLRGDNVDPWATSPSVGDSGQDTRIFSPNLPFVSPCGIKANDCRIMTYETDGRPTKHQSRTKGASLVRVLVRAVRFTRYVFGHNTGTSSPKRPQSLFPISRNGTA